MSSAPTDQVGKRLLFENDRVRVWDLSVAPGESFAAHRHQLDYVIIVESGGLLRFDDPDAPGGQRDIQYVDDQVTFRAVAPGGKLDHRLTNVGATPHRNFIVELKPQ
jgi:hypothetical protein